MTEWVDVCATNGIAPGEWLVVDVDGVDVAVFNVDGEFHAIEDVCTHDGACLTGEAIEGEEVICPRHGARFNIKTGKALTAPAYEDVASLPVQIVDGRIQVRDDRWD
ncbi:MAG: non-heme iron oxygenase ferredoxin subunit [Gammaproteobacteria bacterium]